MSTAQPIEVKKDGLRQMQDGTWKLSLTVHPNDMPTSLMTAQMGTRYGMALVEIGDDEQPVSGPGDSTGPEKPKRKPAETHSDKANRLCGVLAFQQYVWGQIITTVPKPPISTPSDEYNACSNRVKSTCYVKSKKEFDTDPEAAKRWETFLLGYEQSAGRSAERIGG